MHSVPINFENNFVCAKQSVEGAGRGGGGGWTNIRGREKRDGRENNFVPKFP